MGILAAMSFEEWLIPFDYGVLLPLAGRVPYTLAHKIAEFRGWLHYVSRQHSRHCAETNVSRVFPSLKESEVRRVVLGHYQTESRDEVETYWYPRPLGSLSKFTQIKGLDALREAADSGSGVLLFSGHLGSMGLLFCVAGKSGIKMNIVGRSIEPEENPLHPVVHRFQKNRVAWIEEAVGNTFVLTGRGNYPHMLEKLNSGEVLMLLIDVVPALTRRTVPVAFFGAPAHFADGIASLFRESRARLFRWMIHWNPESRTQHIEFLDVTDSVDRNASNTCIIQSLVHYIEDLIRTYPDHWLSWDSLEHFYAK